MSENVIVLSALLAPAAFAAKAVSSGFSHASASCGKINVEREVGLVTELGGAQEFVHFYFLEILDNRVKIP